MCLSLSLCLWKSFLVFIDHIISSLFVPLIFVVHKAIIFPFRYDLPLYMQLIHVIDRIDGYMTVILNRLNFFFFFFTSFFSFSFFFFFGWLLKEFNIFFFQVLLMATITPSNVNSAMNDEQMSTKT